MTKVQGMTETLEMAGDFESVRSSDNAQIVRPVIHGMTETMDLNAPVYRDEMTSFPSTLFRNPRTTLRQPSHSSLSDSRIRSAVIFGAVALIVAGYFVSKKTD